MNTINYEGIGVFREARLRRANGMGYYAYRRKLLWCNKNVIWNWIEISYGIRNSYKWQLFPIWNMSNNLERSLMLGIWKIYFEIVYHRKKQFNQDRKLFLRRQLWKFYQLVS